MVIGSSQCMEEYKNLILKSTNDNDMRNEYGKDKKDLVFLL